MPSLGYSGALPGPAAVGTQGENVLAMCKVTVPRATTIRALAGWFSGVGGGTPRSQSGKIVLYTDAGTRPGTLLAHTVEGTWQYNIGKASYAAQLDPSYGGGKAIAAGTYWIGMWTSAATVSQTTLNIHGDTTGGTSLVGVALAYSNTAPPTNFPAGGTAGVLNFGYSLVVDPVASASTGSIVGTFKVGDGHKVGPPSYLPGPPQLTLRGKPINIVVAGDLKQVNPGKAQMTLGTPFGSAIGLSISSSVTPSQTALSKLSLNGKTFRTVTPGRQITGKPAMLLAGKTIRVNVSQTPRFGKAQLILRGGSLGKVGKAGLVPTVPVAGLLVPDAVVEYGELAPTPTDPDRELLVPTVVEYV